MGADPQPNLPDSLAGVCQVELVSGRGSTAAAAPSLLIELPHGATRRRHFEATRRRLVGDYPDDLEQFFFVNTDVGSIECARWVARMVTAPEAYPELRGERQEGLSSVFILRGLVARTFVDCNRVLSGGLPGEAASAVTPGLPPYVSDPRDVRTLTELHSGYQSAAAAAYAAVCGAGGRALILHTYTPRTVRLESVDGGIVAALRRAYAPGTWEAWPRRPDVDLITVDDDGTRLAPAGLVEAVRERYARIGVEAKENATYRLHEATMGYRRSADYPGRVLCLELNRELLAEPFTPFAEMSIGEARARRLAAPIAAALLASTPS